MLKILIIDLECDHGLAESEPEGTHCLQLTTNISSETKPCRFRVI